MLLYRFGVQPLKLCMFTYQTFMAFLDNYDSELTQSSSEKFVIPAYI